MGLGKTVQMIALVVSNPPKQFIPFMNRRLDNDGSDTAYRTSLYKKMKVSHLKKELKDRGLKQSGTKDALIEALKTDDFASPTVTLIVCPTSVLATWMTEITKHVQEDYLKVLLYYGSKGLPILPP